jgi:hypothetical protein
VDAGFLRRDALGLLWGVEGFADLPPRGASLGQIEPVPGLPFG